MYKTTANPSPSRKQENITCQHWACEVIIDVLCFLLHNYYKQTCSKDSFAYKITEVLQLTVT